MSANFFTCNRQPSLLEQIHPRLNFVLNSIGLLTDLCALVPSVIIWGDYFRGRSGVKEYFQVQMCSAIFLLVSTAMLDTIQGILELSSSTELKLDRELEEVQNLFQEVSEEHLFSLIPQGLQRRLSEALAQTTRSPTHTRLDPVGDWSALA